MEEISQVLAEEDTVLFIGSGISMWSGLPSWSGMIEELARFIESTGTQADLIREEAQKGDLLQAASYGFDRLTKQQIGVFIRSASRYGFAKPHDIHRKIVSLGPRCFITTNYDNLIEESVRKWRPDRPYRVVTNRQLTETAEIIHARATDFIFKPHGDAADIESIILTREQYRQLLPQGERQAALESLKMMLASRPVVYLGFGLRDPDFIYMRDLLANTYKGGTRDHYAIMADVSDAESDYWRRNYGIHLINYATTERPDKTRDHTALIILLDTLLQKAPVTQGAVGFDPSSPGMVLALARHAAGLARAPKLMPEFQIRVHNEEKEQTGNEIAYGMDRFYHYPIANFLDDGPERAILIGLPGAGKTYSIRRAAARLAEKLHEACLSEPFDKKSVLVPILADLKLYRGSLDDLVSQTLPKSLPLYEIIRHYRVKIFLDAFNEMPREYSESGCYESDFEKFVSRIGHSSLIISSRTSDGLGKLGLPAYCLDQIEEADVTAELQRLGIEIAGRFDHEVRLLLQRPFFFQYVRSGAVKLPREAHPRDFYRVFFDNLQKAFAARFRTQLDIEKVLSLAAYDALNRGEEAFPLSDLLSTLKTGMEMVGVSDIAIDVANWLVSSSVLIPHTGGRVAFVHQSITEYLAATELARRYQLNPDILKEKLRLKRWDQALFLTLSLMPAAQGETFLEDVIRADFCLALNAAKYLEVSRNEVIKKLLLEIPRRIQASALSDRQHHDIAAAVKFALPLENIHEPYLRALIKSGDMIGAAAALRLVALKGEKVKDELLSLLVEHCDDYNLCCNGIGPALQAFATEEDAKKIATWTDSFKGSVMRNPDDLDGFICGAASFLGHLELSSVRRTLLPEGRTKISRVRAHILCDILQNHHSTTALEFAAELLLRGINKAATTIYFISEFAEPLNELSWVAFNSAHLDRLESMLDNPDEDSWGLQALRCLCAVRPDIAELVKAKAKNKAGIKKAALLYSVSPTDLAPTFQALDELTEMREEERREQPIQILQWIEFDWLGREELFVKLLKLRDMQLASALFRGRCPPDLNNLGNVEIGPIGWWLEWMSAASRSRESEWFLNQLGSLFGGHLAHDVQDEFVSEFNRSDSKFRRVLLHFVLPYFAHITTDSFSEDAISFLLSDLRRNRTMLSFRGHLLGMTATEQFVTEHLLPLLRYARQPFSSNLHAVLEEAAARHGKRYVFETELNQTKQPRRGRKSK